MLRSLGFTGIRLFSTSRVFAAPKPAAGMPSFDFMTNAEVAETEVTAPTERLENNVVKKFHTGDLYDPFDFSIAKIRLDKKKAQENYRGRKFFDEKKANPLDYYTDTKYLSSYITSTGRILPREVTKLSLKNQKRLAKALKRARAAGLLSSVHKDTQLLNFTNDFSYRN